MTLVLLVISTTGPLSACPVCRVQAAAGIYNSHFNVTLFLVLLPILILTLVGLAIYYAEIKRG